MVLSCYTNTHTRHSQWSARLRDLKLLKRVCPVSIFQFSRLRYHTQVLPIPDEERRMISATGWFLRSDSICRVPLSTLSVYITAVRRAGCHSQVHHLFLNRCIRLLQRDGTLTAEWIELWNRTIAPGKPPNIRSIPVGLNYLRLLFREICYFPSDIYFPPPEGTGAPNCIHSYDLLCKFCSWFESMSNIYMPSGQLFGKSSPAPRCLTRRDLRGTGSYTGLQPRRHDNTASTHRTWGCVSSVTYRHTTAQTHIAHCHLRTIAKATSQDSCRTTYGHQICTPKWTVLPDVTVWPKTKTSRDDTVTGYYVHCVMRNGSSVTLHDHMDFLRKTSNKAEEIRKKTTSLALTWKNVRDRMYTCSLVGTPFL